MMNAAASRKYPFTRQVEMVVALATSSCPQFYETIGYALDPARFAGADTALIVKTAQSVAKSKGGPSTSAALVLQEVRTLVDAGRVTYDAFHAVEACLSTAADTGLMDDIDGLLERVIPVVQQYASHKAMENALSGYAKGVDPSDIAEEFEQVAKLGVRRESTGFSLDELTTAEQIKRVFSKEARKLLPTGITELDNGPLYGGLPPQALGVVTAPTGVGKSLMLCQIATEALLQGEDVAYLTLELEAEEIMARICANLFDMPHGEAAVDSEKAMARLGALRLMYDRIGSIEVSKDTAAVTTIQHVRKWLKDMERRRHIKPRVLIVDMADHLTVSSSRETRSYEEMRQVYNGIREIAVERHGWCWTASHVKTGNAGKKRTGTDDLADSQNKARVADIVLAITQTQSDADAKMVRFSVPKHRTAPSHGVAGPLPTDAEYGRIVQVRRPQPWGDK